jgi:hypothetical protein
MRILILAALLILSGCTGDYSEEKTTEAQFATDTEIVSEIATETLPEATEFEAIEFHADIRHEQEFITNTTEKETEATEQPTTEKQTEEPTTAEMIEESTGEIDVDGYGWVELQYSAVYHVREDHLTRSNGVVYAFGHRETWYSTNEGCGQTTAHTIPGKHTADDGTIRDGDGFICVASSDLPAYSIVMTTVGPGKVYDCGCSSGTVDVYTNW